VDGGERDERQRESAAEEPPGAVLELGSGRLLDRVLDADAERDDARRQGR
jgi:hypothetical protein